MKKAHFALVAHLLGLPLVSCGRFEDMAARLLLLWFGLGLLIPQITNYQGMYERLPIKVAPQPVSFDHLKHSSLGLGCQQCHSQASREERAGLPPIAQCMLCHDTLKKSEPEIQKLAQFHQEGKEPPWVRVYELPDFVTFGHSRHLEANLKCAICHGPIEKREILAKEVSTSMKVCVACHLEKQASIDCDLCHDLAQ